MVGDIFRSGATAPYHGEHGSHSRSTVCNSGSRVRRRMHTLNTDRAHGQENCLYETTTIVSSADIIVAYKLLLFKISVLTILLHCATSRDGEH
jgi:hypothetical protein